MNAKELENEIVEAVRKLVASVSGAPEYYDQGNSPLGRAMHLRLARSGELPSSKIGRKVIIRRTAIDAYIERHRSYATAKATDDQLVEQAKTKILERGRRRRAA